MLFLLKILHDPPKDRDQINILLKWNKQSRAPKGDKFANWVMLKTGAWGWKTGQ